MASSSNLHDALSRIQDYEYLYASNTNVSNFVSVKLSGDRNYHLWKKQMLCLMEAHDMRGLVDDGPLMKKYDSLLVKKYDSLLKGWIFGSVSEEVLSIVVDDDTAKDVWKKLKSYFDSTMTSKQDSVLTKANTKTKTEDKNVVLGKSESEAKGEEDSQIEIKETETHDKVESDVVLSNTKIKERDMDSAESGELNSRGSDSESTEVDKKIETNAENAETENNELRQLIVDGDWDGVYIELVYSNEITKKINSNGNTLLHIAVGISRNDLVRRIISRIRDHDLTKIKNSDGSTVLHIAAIVGNTNAAELLVKENKNLLHIKDEEGQTPLDKAYANMHLNTIASLLKAAEDNQKGKKIVWRGQKVANVDQKGLPAADVEGTTQTMAGVDGTGQPAADVDGAGKTTADIEGTRSTLLPSVEIGVDLLVNAVSAKQYDFASKLISSNPEYAVSKDNVLMAVARTFPRGLGYGETLIYPSLDNMSEMMIERTKRLFDLTVDISSTLKEITWSILSCEDGFRDALKGLVMLIILIIPYGMVYWMYHLILLILMMVYFPFFMLYLLLWKAAMIVVPPIKNIEQKKKEYKEAKNVLELVLKTIIEKRPDSSRDLYTKPILEAACQDAYEVVDEILGRWPEAIRCKDNNGYDIIQLATIHRSERIYNLIYFIGERKSLYRTMEDSSKNNMLHLAGRLAPSNKLKRRTGAALQLQRELQWRQEVEKLVFPTYVTKENILMETPAMVFTKEHENLVKEGEKWMKTVAESCSITAALITTIVFAAAITVPGGSDQETGVPVFLTDFVFNVFAIADAISLFSSATALLVFLSILTARFAEEDFLVRLPRRLIIGLCTLLLSTTTMMVAFSATLFLVFSRRKLWVLGPTCGLALVPIAFFFILQFPLILDLFRSTYISRFGKSNHNSSKLIQNDIRYFFSK